MNSLSRREFLAAGAAAAALAGCGSSSTRPGSLTLMESSTESLDWAPIMLAQKTGLFRAQHLDVGILNAPTSSQALQQLIAGNATVGRMTSFTAARAIANERAPVVAIGTDYQESALLVVSRRAHPIRTLQDLAGKTVGVGNLQGGTKQVLDVELERQGVPLSSVRIIQVGTSAAAFGFLTAGRADAILARPDELALIGRSDPSIVSFNLTGLAPIFGVSYVVTHETLQQRRTDLIRFLRALRVSMKQIIDPSTRPAALRRLSGSGLAVLADPTAAQQATAQMVTAWLAAGPENVLRNVPHLWSEDVQTLRETHVLSAGASAASMYTNALVDAAGG